MRMPNGYGSVYKLSGKRRRPYIVRKTVGWDENGRQIYAIIGYTATRDEGLKLLAEYNSHPYDIKARNVTFAEVYEKWSGEKFPTISKSNVHGYRASYSLCEKIKNYRFADIRLADLQEIVDTCGKNYPTLRKLKVLFSQVYEYAMRYEICDKDYSELVDIAKHSDKKSAEEKHKKFTDREIQTLWKNLGENEDVSVWLMLIYSGVRVSELLDLKKEDVHPEERWFYVRESKTESGVRQVPIAAATLPLFEKWMAKKGEYLISTPSGKHLKYENYRDNYWDKTAVQLGMDHLPHDTRHTTVSLLARANVSQGIIKRIVGHSGAMTLTERVYTHQDISELVEAVDKIHAGIKVTNN